MNANTKYAPESNLYKFADCTIGYTLGGDQFELNFEFMPIGLVGRLASLYREERQPTDSNPVNDWAAAKQLLHRRLARLVAEGYVSEVITEIEETEETKYIFILQLTKQPRPFRPEVVMEAKEVLKSFGICCRTLGS